MKERLFLPIRPADRLLLTTLLSLLILTLVASAVFSQSRDSDDDDEEKKPRRGIIITIDPDEDEDDDDDWSRGDRDHRRFEDQEKHAQEELDDYRERRRDEYERRAEEYERKAEELERRSEELEEMRRVPRAPRAPRIEGLEDFEDLEDLDDEDFGGHVRIEIDSDEGQIVRIGRNLRIREHQLVENAVVFFGDLTVEGEIEEDAVVIGGTLRVEDDAVIGGDVVVVGGSLDIDRGAWVRGERVEVGKIGPMAVMLGVAPRGDRGHHARQLLSTFLVLFVLLCLAWLVHLLIGDRIQVMSETIAATFWKSLLIGLLISLLYLPAVILFAITVIGIPVSLLLLFAAPLAGLLAFLCGAHALGRRVASGVRFERQSSLGYLMVGVIGIGALFLLGSVMGVLGRVLTPVAIGLMTAGVVLAGGLKLAGLGAMLTSRFGRIAPETPPSIGTEAALPPGPPAAPAAPSAPEAIPPETAPPPPVPPSPPTQSGPAA